MFAKSKVLMAAAIIVMVGLHAAPARAQNAPTVPTYASEAVYLELGGPTVVASLNYDRLLAERWAVRVGLEVDGSGSHMSEWYPQVPLTVSRVFLHGSHGVELGGGAVLTFPTPRDHRFMELVLHTAYRRQVSSSGLFLRTELLTMPGDDWFTWAGLGVGYAF